MADPGPASPSKAWLFSERADFWVASAGGGALLIMMALVLSWGGDRELSVADLLLAELHLGATYDAVIRRRLWRRMPLDVLAMPLAIMVATHILLLNDGTLLVTTAIVYLGAWHRGRQNLGIARYYQRRAGGPVSSWHRWLLGTAFYLPMIAAVAYYTTTAPTHEGDAFHHLALGSDVLLGLAGVAAASVVAYLGWATGRTAAPGDRPSGSVGSASVVVHPCERWLVLANALGFASAYALGAWASSFILVLVIHHEVQYLYFTYAVARRAEAPPPGGRGGSSAARAVLGMAGDRTRVLGGVQGLRARRARALPDGRPARSLLAGRPHLDCASPAPGTAVAAEGALRSAPGLGTSRAARGPCGTRPDRQGSVAAGRPPP
jgi:hypothetical protein